jgi:hypothetical protein
VILFAVFQKAGITIMSGTRDRSLFRNAAAGPHNEK